MSNTPHVPSDTDAAQSAGAALLMPNSLAILERTFSGVAKGRAIGMWAAAGAISAAIGPVLGGWVVDLGGCCRNEKHQFVCVAGHGRSGR